MQRSKSSIVKRSQLNLDKCVKNANFEEVLPSLLIHQNFGLFDVEQKQILTKLLYSKYFTLRLKKNRIRCKYQDFDDFLNNYKCDCKQTNSSSKNEDDDKFWIFHEQLNGQVLNIATNAESISLNDAKHLNIISFTDNLSHLNTSFDKLIAKSKNFKENLEIALGMSQCLELKPIEEQFYESEYLNTFLRTLKNILMATQDLTENILKSELRIFQLFQLICMSRGNFYKQLNDFIDGTSLCHEAIAVDRNIKHTIEPKSNGFAEFFEFETFVKSWQNSISSVKM